jgi:hypothetical protein
MFPKSFLGLVPLFILYTQQIHANAKPLKKMPDRLFSSRNINNVAHNLIIRNDKVVLQRKSDVLTPQEILEKRRIEEEEKQKAIEKAEKDGLPPPDFNRMNQKNVGVIDDGDYEYIVPKDGCYILENGFTFCSKDGMIIKVFKEITNPQARDYFFYQNEPRCKIAKYNFMYNFLYNKRLIIYHQYQLAFSTNLYPELVRIIVFSEHDLLEPEDLDLAMQNKTPFATRGIVHQFDKDMMALFISYKKDVGCLPFNKIKLFDTDEEKTFPIFLEKYVLAGEWTKDIDFPNSILMATDGPFVEYYNKDIVPVFKRKLVERRGVDKQ